MTDAHAQFLLFCFYGGMAFALGAVVAFLLLGGIVQIVEGFRSRARRRRRERKPGDDMWRDS